MRLLYLVILCIAVMVVQVAAQNPKRPQSGSASNTVALNAAAPQRAGSLPMVPDPKQVGGEPEGVVQVANLIYAGVKSSQCFSDHFLITAEKESAISTSRRFHAVKLAGDEVFNFPLGIMTVEGTF